MKDVRMALRAILLSDATVSALVGGNRIMPIRLEQGQKNASIVYNRITEEGHYQMNGPAGIGQARMQVDSWGSLPSAAVELANAAYDRLSGFQGVVAWGSSSPQEEIRVHGIFLESGREDYDAIADMYRMSRDYMIWYEE